jgi:hypothetical protein
MQQIIGEPTKKSDQMSNAKNTVDENCNLGVTPNNMINGTYFMYISIYIYYVYTYIYIWDYHNPLCKSHWTDPCLWNSATRIGLASPPTELEATTAATWHFGRLKLIKLRAIRVDWRRVDGQIDTWDQLGMDGFLFHTALKDNLWLRTGGISALLFSLPCRARSRCIFCMSLWHCSSFRPEHRMAVTI